MKLSLSNIALSQYHQESELMGLHDLGFLGLEVAPSRVWPNTWNSLTGGAINKYRKLVQRAELNVVGLHSLFFDQKALGLFTTGDQRLKTLDFLVHLSKVCRDLGGKTMIYGGGRWRGTKSLDLAKKLAIDFVSELIPRIESHGTILCFEPLGTRDSDFVNSITDSIELVKYFNHSSFRVQIDAKGLVENEELSAATFYNAKPYLVHVHVNEPDLGELGVSGKISNLQIANYLKEIGYSDYVSLEQRMEGKTVNLESIKRSAKVMQKYYL